MHFSVYDMYLFCSGKRQYAPLVSTEDDMDPEEAEEELREELRLETLHQPDFHEQLRLRQEGQRALRDSETGRHITLSLLTRGKAPEAGRVYHIAPPGCVEDAPETQAVHSSSPSSLLMDPSKTLEDNTLYKNQCRSNTLAAEDNSHPFLESNIFNNISMVGESFNVQNIPSNAIVDLLDDEGDGQTALSVHSSSLSNLLAHDVIPKDEIDKQWQAVLFGRCPDPDFSAPIKERRSRNITCADSLYAEMLGKGVVKKRRV